jgi:hypothetical protein
VICCYPLVEKQSFITISRFHISTPGYFLPHSCPKGHFIFLLLTMSSSHCVLCRFFSPVLILYHPSAGKKTNFETKVSVVSYSCQIHYAVGSNVLPSADESPGSSFLTNYLHVQALSVVSNICLNTCWYKVIKNFISVLWLRHS